ncbi:MAG: EAL domain-containing protein [Chloroflexota bacterium]
MWFLIIRSINEELRDYTLKPGRNTLGREAENDIVVYDDAASRYHAEIYFDDKKNIISVKDLKSTNGTFVNGKRIDHQIIQHEDQIRIGFYLIALLNSDLLSIFDPFAIQTKNTVTKELVIESIEHYGVLLHDVGRRLVNMPSLGAALDEITRLVKTMLGADECQIILADEFDSLQERGISTSLAQDVIAHHTAYLTSLEGPHEDADNTASNPKTLLLAPVMIEDKVAALIFVRKNETSKPFYKSDMQFILAIGNQVALSIQRNRVQAEMLHKSFHDSLTGLPNRTLFLDRLQQSIARDRRKLEGLFAVLFFDIDNFKIVNDSLGHTAGDKLLIAIAARLEENFREIDTIARISAISRFGGDEFAILLNDIGNIDHALMIATRLQELMSKPFDIAGKEIYTSISIGIALSAKHYEKPEDILRDADIAMYQAKELGKERIEIYDTAMHNQIVERMQLVTDLKKGAVEREFRLHYQPIVSLKTGRIVGHEALLRWYKPERGILEPNMFMGLLDTGGLLYTTDGWVLHTACVQAVKWQKEFPQQPPLFMCVNISAANLKHPNFVDHVHHILQETGLAPNILWLEVTENISAVSDKAAIEVLRKLHASGIRISVDDFGTGYSALNYLVQFPIHALKIDRSFIQMIGVSDESLRVIETIKALADHLGLSVIAEGVDEPRQLAFLKELDCEYVQGFLLAHPMDAEAAAKNFTEQKIF